jgi:hypothetical protein
MRVYTDFSDNLVIETLGPAGNAGAWPYGALVQESSTSTTVTVVASRNWSNPSYDMTSDPVGVEWYFAATLAALTSSENIANPAFDDVRPSAAPPGNMSPRFTVQNLEPGQYYYVRARVYFNGPEVNTPE